MRTDPQNKMAETIRAAFRKNGMTIKQLTRNADVFYSTTFRFLKGDGDLTLTGATKICDVLGLELKPKGKR